MNTLLQQLNKGELPEMPLSLRTESIITLGLVAVLSAIAIIAVVKLFKEI